MTVDNSISCVQQDSNVSWGQQIIELLGHNRGIIICGAAVRGAHREKSPSGTPFSPLKAY